MCWSSTHKISTVCVDIWWDVGIGFKVIFREDQILMFIYYIYNVYTLYILRMYLVVSQAPNVIYCAYIQFNTYIDRLINLFVCCCFTS